MKIRKRPNIPVNKVTYYNGFIYDFKDIFDNCSVLEAIDNLKLKAEEAIIKCNPINHEIVEGTTLKDCFFGVEDSYYEEPPEYYISIPVKETEYYFKTRIKSYQKRLKSYEDWYDKNKDKITEEIKKREAKFESDKKKLKASNKKKLEASIRNLEKDLAKKTAQLRKQQKEG